LLWTIIPAIVLAGIIIGGLTVWNKITTPKEDTTVIEIYAQQFGWTVRYAGEDNTLGNSDFKVIDESKNPLGVVTTKLINAREKSWTKEIDSLTTYIAEKGDLTPDAIIDEIEDKIERLGRQIRRLDPLRKAQTAETNAAATDDVIVKELHLVKGKDYEFKFRSRDVIHSALFPHFRAQMNCVPGMTTRFSFKPVITTAEMRAMPDVQKQYKEASEKRVANGKEAVEFDYLLLCNKICGSSHYNMQIKIIVETQEEFDVWYAKQSESKTFEMLAGLESTVVASGSIDTNVAAIDTVNLITESASH
jgi:cytochrome c oxidase subunit 2